MGTKPRKAVQQRVVARRVAQVIQTSAKLALLVFLSLALLVSLIMMTMPLSPLRTTLCLQVTPLCRQITSLHPQVTPLRQQVIPLRQQVIPLPQQATPFRQQVCQTKLFNNY